MLNDLSYSMNTYLVQVGKHRLKTSKNITENIENKAYQGFSFYLSPSSDKNTEKRGLCAWKSNRNRMILSADGSTEQLWLPPLLLVTLSSVS